MNTKETPWGAFCELFGATARNRVLEIFLEGREVDNGLGNVAEEAKLNRASVYNVASGLLKHGIIIPSRIVGRTQLYKLNSKNDEAKLLSKSFDDALRLVAREIKRAYKVKVV